MDVRGLAALALTTIACRTDVAGWWSGSADGEPLLLKLEQTGSILEGEVCTDQACTPIEWGDIEERSIELQYGCQSCGLPSTTLHLVVERGRLVGEADASPCACEHGDQCDCLSDATFFPCQGACSAGASSAD